MKISPSFYTKDSQKNYQSFKGVLPDRIYIPEAIGKLGTLAGKYVNTPEQKLILASTALLIHPLIDLKYAEDDKKIDSAIKSMSKTIAGGITGISIRAICIKVANMLIGFRENTQTKKIELKPNKLNVFFMPKSAKILQSQNPQLGSRRMTNYCNTLGTIVAILAMTLITNPRVDVPLTNFFQDVFSGIIKENKGLLESINDVRTQNKLTKKPIHTRINNKIESLITKTKKIIGIIKDKNIDTENK